MEFSDSLLKENLHPNMIRHKELETQLKTMIYDSKWLMAVLHEVKSLNLPNWCIGAGVIRNLVWDALHGYSSVSRWNDDIDVIYINNLEPKEFEQQHQAFLNSKHPQYIWDVVNQSYIHLWYKEHFNQNVKPITSLNQAISMWPEYMTCVGVNLSNDHHIQVIAPYGLEDLFAMHVRHNPVFVSIATYQQRIYDKAYQVRWPKVKVFRP